MVDLKVALFNTIFLATGVFSMLWVTPYVIFLLQSYLSNITGGTAEIAPTELWSGLQSGIVLFLTQDICRYWNHYLHHETRFLWPFHAVHHSAEVMTPLTFLRAHPLCYALQSIFMSAAMGLVQGLILYVLIGPLEVWVYFAGFWAFNAYVFFGSHLRHSHIWNSYGPVLEHVLISPAQHQVHHSSDPKHHDKNYGEVFAIWDWMFGTLYVPEGPEDLTFGIADGEGVRIDQLHPTLRNAMIGPFEEVWEEVIKGTSRDRSRKTEA